MGYDAFISYSQRADRHIAEFLQKALHRIAKPWYRMRALRVFRDASSLSAIEDLPGALQSALAASRFLVLCASPQADASRWVRQELDFWRAHRDPAHLLIVLTDGEIVWDPQSGSFDWAQTTALPLHLDGFFSCEPLWIDVRRLKASDLLTLRSLEFWDNAVALAASIHGKPKDALDGDDVRQHRRTLRVAWGGGITLLVLLGSATGIGWIALQERVQKEEQRELAAARRLTQSARSISAENGKPRG